MAGKELTPERGAKRPASSATQENPILAFQREMNRVFDNFFSGGFDLFPWAHWERGLQAYNPRVDITDDAKALRVTAELPGMEEKDIEVTLTRDALTIKGQKNQEEEDKGRNYYRMERSYGAFERTVPLPTNIDPQHVQAAFKKGVLTVTIPKTGEARRDVQRIQVKSEA